jgi:hypothetical protein
MGAEGGIQNKWTRWHSDDWTAVVVLSTDGHYAYNAWQGDAEGDLKNAPSRVAAQHAAEAIVRESGHRCTARCSFWVPDNPEELG